MQFWSHCYTVVSYQALFRLSVYKIPAVYLSGAKNVCFCTIGDFGSPTNYNCHFFLAGSILFAILALNIKHKTTIFAHMAQKALMLFRLDTYTGGQTMVHNV